MAEPAPETGVARFGVFELDPETGELRRQGAKIRLQEQPARILEVLLRNHGRVVTREELCAALWPAETFVDFDHSLNTAIRKLRTALDDSADSPRYVETLAKRGYRFLVPVEWTARPGAPPPVADSAPVAAPAAIPRNRRRIALLAAGCVAVIALLAWLILRSSPIDAEYRRIAVLPIENHDPSTAYVSEGIAETILDELATSPSVRVTARASSFHYKERPVDMRTVGSELGVSAVITGSFRSQGGDYRLRLELIDTADGAQIWAKEYTQRAADVHALRARAIRDLSVRMGVSSADTPSTSSNAEAYDLYLRGRYHWNLRSRGEQLRALEYFERASELDPGFAAAWAGVANVCGTLVGSALVPGREEETQRKAFEAAKRAIQLDARNAEAYSSLAASKLSYYNDFDGAERDFRRALDLNPSLATGHMWYSHLLNKVGRPEEARREIDIAWQLDPYGVPTNSGRCFNRLMSRRYDEAIDLARRAQELDPEIQMWRCVSWANIHLGNIDGAVQAVRQASPEMADALERAAAERGMEGYLRAHLGFQPDDADYERAGTHAMLGDHAAALAELERAFEKHRAQLGFMWIDPRFDRLRDDPRFLDLALRVGLPQAKAAAGGTSVPPAPTRLSVDSAK